MKVLFAEAKSKISEVDLDRAIVALAGYDKIALVATVQFLHLLPQVKTVLEKAGKTILVGKPHKRAVKEGQILGCDVTAVPEDADVVLYVGTGEFHALGIKSEHIFTMNPFAGTVTKISEKEIRKLQLRQQARIAKFREAKTVGILVTTKLGQSELQATSQKLKAKLESQGKNVFTFIADTFSPQELQNFPQIEAWVNTACPRLVDDQHLYNRTIVNAEEIDGN